MGWYLPFFLQNVFLYDNLHILKYIYQLPFLISQKKGKIQALSGPRRGSDVDGALKCRNRKKQNYKITGFKIEGEIGATSEQPELGPIKENDLMLKSHYNLF